MDWFVQSFILINIDQWRKMGDQQGVKTKFMTIASHASNREELGERH